ncbi:hypothetical protein OROGR_031361 [Orobanche gracilis]
MSPAIDSGVVLLRTRKQRKRFKRKVKIKAKRRAQKNDSILEEEENVTALVKKYWFQRYSLFSKYDAGIKLDEEGWFSARGNRRPAGSPVRWCRSCCRCVFWSWRKSIQLPKCAIVLLLLTLTQTKSPLHFIMLRSMVYKIILISLWGLFPACTSLEEGDVVFLAPPWGGPSYKAKEKFTLDLLKPKNGQSLFQVAQTITPNIIMYLPRTIDVLQASELSWLSSPPLDIEMEENFVRGKLKGITVYFGDMAFP